MSCCNPYQCYKPATHTQCVNMYLETCIKECFCHTKATLEGISLVCCITVQCMFSLVQITSSNVKTKIETEAEQKYTVYIVSCLLLQYVGRTNCFYFLNHFLLQSFGASSSIATGGPQRECQDHQTRNCLPGECDWCGV